MTNDLLLNGKDAWTEYRANLEEGSVLELIIPNPKKDYVESNVRNAHGRIMRGTEWDDTSEKTLTFHIVGTDMKDSFSFFKKFCDDVLAEGKFALKSKYLTETFTFIYRNCTPISSNNGIFKFNVKVVKEFFKQENR